MTLPDLKTLTDAGGWVAAVAVVIAVLALFATGKIVAGSTYEREVKRGDALDATVTEQTNLMRSQGAKLGEITVAVGFLADFAKQVILESGRQMPHEAEAPPRRRSRRDPDDDT